MKDIKFDIEFFGTPMTDVSIVAKGISIFNFNTVQHMRITVWQVIDNHIRTNVLSSYNVIRGVRVIQIYKRDYEAAYGRL